MTLPDGTGVGIKCQHDACTCLVVDRTGFCSEVCRTVGNESAHCACGHPGCHGAIGTGDDPVQF